MYAPWWGREEKGTLSHPGSEVGGEEKCEDNNRELNTRRIKK